MLTTKKKLEDLKAQHEQELKELEAKHATALEALTQEAETDKGQALEQQLADSEAKVAELMKEVNSMGQKLNVMDKVPELVKAELEKRLINDFDTEELKKQLLADAEVKSQEQQVQEEAVNAEFNDNFDKALESVNV